MNEPIDDHAQRELVSKPALLERLRDCERQLADIAQAAIAIAMPARAEVKPGELVELVRGLFDAGQKLAIENAQLRALLKKYL